MVSDVHFALHLAEATLCNEEAFAKIACVKSEQVSNTQLAVVVVKHSLDLSIVVTSSRKSILDVNFNSRPCNWNM